jgi:hypothetical protein
VSPFVVLVDELVPDDEVLSVFWPDSDFPPPSVFFSLAVPDEPVEPPSLDDFFA